MDEQGRITRILRDGSSADGRTLDRVMPLVYDELRELARAQLADRPRGGTMGTTVLIHEAYLRLADQTRASFPDRVHFFAYAARVMRTILVDHARARGARKRGGGWTAVELDARDLPVDTQADLILSIDEALSVLGEQDPRLVRVVEYRYFGGLSEVETADVLDVTPRTVRRDWVKARAWLHARLSDAATEGAGPG